MMLYVNNNTIRMYSRGDSEQFIDSRDFPLYCERIQSIYGHMGNLYPHLRDENIVGTKLTVNMKKNFKHEVCSPWPSCFTVR